MSSTAGEHNPIALYGQGPSLLSLPELPEAPCSVNCFFELGTMKAQATGRGRTPQEAAKNLRDTIDETQKVLGNQLTFSAKLGKYIGRLVTEASEQGNWHLIERIGLAASLVTHGSVFAHPEDDAMYVVWDHEEIEQEFVHQTAGCECDGLRGWQCEHGLAVIIALHCDAVGIWNG